MLLNNGYMRAVIDIGSSSVRLMLEGVKLKDARTTRLSEGLSNTGSLGEGAMSRTVHEIVALCNKARDNGATEIFCFATEAVRAADNGTEFADRVRKATGLNVEVLTGDEEAQCGFVGASAGRMSGLLNVVDIGGASVELAMGRDGVLKDTVSRPIGVVRLRDMFGSDKLSCAAYIKGSLASYPKIPRGSELVGIGGTFSSSAAILLGLKVYDPYKVDGYRLTAEEIGKLNTRLWAMTDEERVRALEVLSPKRAEVINYGVQLIESMMQYFGCEITVSESDNLEGYLALRHP